MKSEASTGLQESAFTPWSYDQGDHVPLKSGHRKENIGAESGPALSHRVECCYTDIVPTLVYIISNDAPQERTSQ